MVKFRCPHCGQKIGVNDEGAGVVISCPTCVASIVVPTETQVEFRQLNPSPAFVPLAPVELVDSVRTSEPLQQNEAVVVERRAGRIATLLRAELRPHLARLMMDKLVGALFSQRAHLLETQQASTERVTAMEERLIKIQGLLQARLNTYGKRVNELEKQLAQAQEENRELVHTRFQLAKKIVELEARQQTRVSLRDAGFLLRA